MFVCAVSGTTAPEGSQIDELEDGTELPRGWTVLTLQRSKASEGYVEVQSALNAAIAGAKKQVEDAVGAPSSAEERQLLDDGLKAAEHTVRAMFHGYVAAHSPFEVDEVEVFLDTTQPAVVKWLKENLEVDLDTV